MFRLVLKRMLNQKVRVIVTVLAMITIFTLIPLGIHFAQESKLAVTETIEEHGRGTYDILVRPANSRTPIEQELGVVEENYIGDSKGGISIEEWETIKEMKDVEIAAPVASLGYFSGHRTNIGLPLLDHPARFIWQFSTSDGVYKYPVDEPVTFTYFEHHLEREGQWAEFVYPGETAVGYFGFRMPFNYYLLTGIDVESEERLTGIDYGSLHKDPMDSAENEHLWILQVTLKNRDNPDVFPILQRKDLNIPLYLSLTVEELDIDLAKYKEKCKVDKDLPIYYCDSERREETLVKLDEEPALSSDHYELDLTPYQNPFDGTALQLSDDMELSDLIGGSMLNDTSLYYTAEKIAYHISDDGIRVKIVEDGIPPSYKHVEQKGESFYDVYDPPFILWQMGDFLVPEDEDTLAASPLGIYGSEDVRTEDGTQLTSTIIPGSFIAAPAAGVTTLEAAEHIKGDEPIDAIRIRVVGGEEYDVAAQERIDRLSLQLLEQGYEVDVVAGASFKRLDMDVEGIGKVSAKWTTLGIAQSLTSGFNALALFTTICFALFGIAWFSTRLVYEKNAKAEEDVILAQIGWRSSLIKRRNIYEQFIILTGAFLISLVALLFTNIDFTWYGYLALVYLLMVMFMVGLFLVSRGRGRELRKESKGFLYYKRLIFPVTIVIIFSIGLTIVLFTSLIQSLLTARESTLGAFVVDEMLYLQVFVLITTVVLVLISITEAINAIIRERKDEFIMYHTIGWSRRMIRFHFGKEVFLWAGLSLIIGGVISSIILFQIEVSLQWIGISFSTVLILFIIGITAIVWTRKYGEKKGDTYASSN